MQTAEVVARGSVMHEDTLLAELDSGAVNTMLPDQARQYLPWELERAQLHSRFHYRPLAGESFMDLERRVRQFLLTLALRKVEGTIGVVTHDRWMQMLVKNALGWSVRDFQEWRKSFDMFPNACVLVFEHLGADTVRFLEEESSATPNLK